MPRWCLPPWYEACSTAIWMRRIAIALGASVALAAGMLACGSRRLPPPRWVSQPTSALVQVPYPPPPARVEFIPDQPRDDAVWIDGEWVWQGRRYAWKPGRWVVPPPNAAFAPWTAVRDRLGTLYLAQGTWRAPGGGEVAPPRPLRVGRPNAGTVTNPEGEPVSDLGLQPPGAFTPKPGGAPTRETRAAPELIVDSGPEIIPDAEVLPDGSVLPDDSGLLPEAGAFDASLFDAMPLGAR